MRTSDRDFSNAASRHYLPGSRIAAVFHRWFFIEDGRVRERSRYVTRGGGGGGGCVAVTCRAERRARKLPMMRPESSDR